MLMLADLLFESWDDVLRVVIAAVVGYAALILFLRLGGKRTLSKINAFDLAITVTFGSTLATIALNDAVTLTQGLTAIVVLVLLQSLVAWGVSRTRAFGRIVKSDPTLLLRRGELLHDRLLSERIAPGEIDAAIRQEGYARREDIYAVVLETDGTFSVIAEPPAEGREATALETLGGQKAVGDRL